MKLKNFKLFKRSEKDPNRLKTWPMLLSVIFFVLFGALLIWLRETALTIAAYVLAALMLIFGGCQVFVYLRSVPIRRITESRLATGLILILCGALLAFNTHMLDTLFPVLWGLSLLFGCFLKIQYAFDEFSVRIQKWWIMLAFAAFSLLIGLLALLRPDFLGDSKELVIGIFLIAEAVLDAVVVILLSRALKNLSPSFGQPAAVVQDEISDGNVVLSEAPDPAFEKPELPKVPVMDPNEIK